MSQIYLSGLILNSEKTAKITNSLLLAGIKSDHLKVQEIEQHVYAVSILITDHYDERIARNILDFYKCKKVFQTHSNEKSELRNHLSSHSKSEIFKSPEIRYHHHHEGMNSEVQF